MQTDQQKQPLKGSECKPAELNENGKWRRERDWQRTLSTHQYIDIMIFLILPCSSVTLLISHLRLLSGRVASAAFQSSLPLTETAKSEPDCCHDCLKTLQGLNSNSKGHSQSEAKNQNIIRRRIVGGVGDVLNFRRNLKKSIYGKSIERLHCILVSRTSRRAPPA